MNYFELYELPVSFAVDEGHVKRKFYELSKKYHPDFYISEPQAVQDEILQLSTLNNKAFQVLSDSLRRIEYVLGLHELISEGEKYQLPQHFLMEMMDVNEALMEQEFDPDPVALEGIRSQVAEIEAGLRAELEKFASVFDSENQDDKNAVLLKIKDIWYREKYLLRIRESLNRFASR